MKVEFCFIEIYVVFILEEYIMNTSKVQQNFQYDYDLFIFMSKTNIRKKCNVKYILQTKVAIDKNLLSVWFLFNSKLENKM